MTQITFLEDFGTATLLKDRPPSEAPREAKGYDEGYEAGWNDALAAETDAASKSLRDMAVALQEAGFTYFEARQHVLKSLQPLLRGISDAILPELAQSSLGPKVAETLEHLAHSLEKPIEILCPPASEQTLREICEEHIKFPITISTEDSLANQQVLFRYADGTADLNITQCVADIQSLITQFYETLNAQEVKHA